MPQEPKPRVKQLAGERGIKTFCLPWFKVFLMHFPRHVVNEQRSCRFLPSLLALDPVPDLVKEDMAELLNVIVVN